MKCPICGNNAEFNHGLRRYECSCGFIWDLNTKLLLGILAELQNLRGDMQKLAHAINDVLDTVELDDSIKQAIKSDNPLEEKDIDERFPKKLGSD